MSTSDEVNSGHQAINDCVACVVSAKDCLAVVWSGLDELAEEASAATRLLRLRQGRALGDHDESFDEIEATRGKAVHALGLAAQTLDQLREKLTSLACSVR